jgi:hypothetical protein
MQYLLKRNHLWESYALVTKIQTERQILSHMQVTGKSPERTQVMGNVKGTERIFGDEPLAKMKTQNIQKG